MKSYRELDVWKAAITLAKQVYQANELDTQLEIAREVELGDAKEIWGLQREALRVTMMLRGLIRSLNGRKK